MAAAPPDERGERLETARLLLEPLDVAHAAEMAAVLADPALYLHTGGGPPRAEELRERYERRSRGRSPDGSQRWLNWVVRARASGEAVGYVQATIGVASGEAEVAWVIGTRFQHRGYAREAAAAMVSRLREQRVARVAAHVHPDNEASAGVARAIGLVPTSIVVDGELRWESRS